MDEVVADGVGGPLAEDRPARVAGDDPGQGEDEEDDPEQDRDRDEQPAEDEAWSRAARSIAPPTDWRDADEGRRVGDAPVAVTVAKPAYDAAAG